MKILYARCEGTFDVIPVGGGRRVPIANNLAAISSAFDGAGVEMLWDKESGAVGVRVKDPNGAAVD